MYGVKGIVDVKKLYDQLRNGIVEVVFTKADGTERILKGTLQDAYVPEDYHTTELHPVLDQVTMSVIDTEINEWRAFRLDKIKSIKVL